MAFKKRFKKRFKRKAKVPKKVRAYVRKAIHSQVENKFIRHDLPLLTPISNNATAILLNGMFLGSDVDHRIGERIRMMKLTARFAINYNPAILPGATSSNFCRIILVYDKQPNQAGVILNQLFLNGGAGNTYISPFNPSGFPRYHILYDKTYMVPIQGGVANVTQSKYVIINKRLKHLTTFTNTNVGDITDITTGALHFILASNTADMLMQFSSNMFYEDA